MDEASTCQNNNGQDRTALNNTIEFYKHALNDHDRQEVLQVLHSLFLTTGAWVTEFEKAFAHYLNARYAVGVMSCTHALELCLRYFGIGAGDEVITTPLSFVATANAIEYVGAKPVFVDVEATTGNINVNLIEQAITKKTKAIIPVHLYGYMVDMQALRKLADAYNLIIIEDAAHCVEGVRDGIRVGQLAEAACFSFYATKNITSGEGGAITTNDTAMHAWLLQARSHGLSSNAAQRYTKKYEHYDQTFLGMKCNMSNIQAGLLLHQLERIEELWQERKSLWDYYERYLSGIQKPGFGNADKHAYHLYTLWAQDEQNRDALLADLYELNMRTAVHYNPIHLMSYYKNKYGYKRGDFPHAEAIGHTTITLPFYTKLTDQERHAIMRLLMSKDVYGKFTSNT